MEVRLRRSLTLWMLSAGGLAFVMVTAGGLAWVVANRGGNLGGIGLSILTSTYMEDLLPRLAMAALFIWGGCLLVLNDSRRRLPAVAAACAIIGVAACLYLVIRTELAFGQAFPDGGASGGWTPGAARAEFLPIPYLSALVQAVFGLVASTTLLAISAVRRSPA